MSAPDELDRYAADVRDRMLPRGGRDRIVATLLTQEHPAEQSLWHRPLWRAAAWLVAGLAVAGRVVALLAFLGA